MNSDYCDRCGAIAKDRFTKDKSDLVFCGHHSREYVYGLIAAGFENVVYTDKEESLVSA